MEEPGGLLAMELHDCSDLAAAAACIHMFKSSDDTLIQHLEISESLCKRGICQLKQIPCTPTTLVENLFKIYCSTPVHVVVVEVHLTQSYYMYPSISW